MTEERKDHTIPEDEFDIEVFVYKLYILFKKFLGILLWPLSIAIRKPLRLLLFASAAALLALALRYMLPPVYQAQFLIRPNDQRDHYFINLSWDLSSLAKENDAEALSRELNIDEGTAKSFTHLDIFPIRKSGDSIMAMQFTIRVTDPANFDTIQNAIIHYLEYNPHYKRIKDLRVTQLESLRSKISRDIGEIDSLKTMLARHLEPRGNGGFIFGQPINPVQVYEEALSLYKEEISLQWQARYIDNFELVKKCVPATKPWWPRFSKLLMITGPLAWIMLIIWNMREEKKQNPKASQEQLPRPAQ